MEQATVLEYYLAVQCTSVQDVLLRFIAQAEAKCEVGAKPPIVTHEEPSEQQGKEH